MPLERSSFWIRFFQDAPIGASIHDYGVPLGRNIELQGIGVGRAQNGINLFRFFFIFEDESVKRILPRTNTAVPNEDYITSPDYVQYRERWAEIPFSPYAVCDLRSLRVEVTNGGGAPEHFEGHFRGVYFG